MKQTKVRRALGLSLLLLSVALSAEEPLQQDTISIMGNRGLPKTMFIAPWKRLGSPLAPGELKSALDEPPDVIDRDVFRRELELHGKGFSID